MLENYFFVRFLYKDFINFITDISKKRKEKLFFEEEAVNFLNDLYKQTQNLFIRYKDKSPAVWETKSFGEDWLNKFSKNKLSEIEAKVMYACVASFREIKEDFKTTRKHDIYDQIINTPRYHRQFSWITDAFFRFEQLKWCFNNDLTDYIYDEIFKLARTISNDVLIHKGESWEKPYYFDRHFIFNIKGAYDELCEFSMLKDRTWGAFHQHTFHGYSQRWLIYKMFSGDDVIPRKNIEDKKIISFLEKSLENKSFEKKLEEFGIEPW